MTDSNNAVKQDAQQQASSQLLAPPASETSDEAKPRQAGEETDSLWSHVWFGLVSVAVVVPMFMPGFLESWLLLVYLGVGAALMVGGGLWGVVSSLLDAGRARRVRRRSWP